MLAGQRMFPIFFTPILKYNYKSARIYQVRKKKWIKYTLQQANLPTISPNVWKSFKVPPWSPWPKPGSSKEELSNGDKDCQMHGVPMPAKVSWQKGQPVNQQCQDTEARFVGDRDWFPREQDCFESLAGVLSLGLFFVIACGLFNPPSVIPSDRLLSQRMQSDLFPKRVGQALTWEWDNHINIGRGVHIPKWGAPMRIRFLNASSW